MKGPAERKHSRFVEDTESEEDLRRVALLGDRKLLFWADSASKVVRWMLIGEFSRPCCSSIWCRTGSWLRSLGTCLRAVGRLDSLLSDLCC